MNKPIVVERFADNGAHSHWDLVDVETGKTLWTEDNDDEPIGKHDVVRTAFNEIGIVRSLKEYVWVTWYYVEIIKGSAFNDVGEIVDYKREQLTKIK